MIKVFMYSIYDRLLTDAHQMLTDYVKDYLSIQVIVAMWKRKTYRIV